MNRENIVQNVSGLYEENKYDIIKQVCNIAYLFENMCFEENPQKEFFDRVEELKYHPYTGKLLLESVAEWSKRHWYEPQELCWRMEMMIETEVDEYKRFINWLYYESIRYSFEKDFFGELTEHISCVFPKDAKEEVVKAMNDTIKIQKIKRRKRLEIDLMKLHYKCDDERIDVIEKFLTNTESGNISNVLKRVRIRDLMTFMMICSQECKERIFNNIDENKINEIEEFQGDALYLRRDTIAECLDYMMHCLWEADFNEN